jgi:hypothetical protein
MHLLLRCCVTLAATVRKLLELLNQSINVTPVAMKLKKLMPAIH